MKRYEILDTTADIGLIAYGRDEEELVENTIDGFYYIAFTERLNYENYERSVELNENSLEDAIFLLLEEMIFYLYAKKIVFKFEKIIVADSKYIIKVNLFKTEKGIDTEVKAVTKHKFCVKRDKGVYKLTVIFDI